MTAPFWKRPRFWLSVPGLLLAIVLAATGLAWRRMRASLPQLDGTVAVGGLSAPVKIERDALGVPTIAGATRADVARALGFLHAQDRFFQMDLMRRNGAGELSELFGAAAVPLDQAHRLHGFRRIAEKSLALLEPDKRAVLEAYSAGVNAGLAALRKSPWEYALLRMDPRPWRPEDSMLVAYAMWFDLQDPSGRFELSLQALRDSIGLGAADFFAPRGTSWDAALDGSTFPAPAVPGLRLQRADDHPQSARAPLAEPMPTGSNNFAVAGRLGVEGGALVANDMHLNLNLPHVWYRAVMRWVDAAGTAHRLVGVTLPGVPALVVGSNGSVAWGYTNSYIDTADVVSLEVENTAQAFYRTPHGFVEIEDRTETIKVKGGAPVAFTARWTEWGPLIASPANGHFLALRWNAHDPAATNLNSLDLELATTVEEAVATGHRMGMPNQNLIVVDRAGHLAWTVTGLIPRRVGFDGRYPVSWAYGDRRWDGWLKSEEVPVVMNPPDGLLWTANQRVVGGDGYAKLGDAGYDDGPRARQIRDDLRQLAASGRKVTPVDLLGVALDDRAVFLERWQQFLVMVLSDDAVAQKSARGGLRDAVRQWNGQASIDSVAYRIVRCFRLHVARKVLDPFFASARASYAGFDYRSFQFDDAVWQLTHDQSPKLLNPEFASWEALLRSAADDVLADIDKVGVTLPRYTWGGWNTLSMRHPFSRVLPAVFAPLLDMPARPLPGAPDMPRVQGASFGASERMVVSPGREEQGIFHMPGGQSGHPLSPYYRAGHDAWAEGRPTPLLPGATEHALVLTP
ncbi:MAG: penicillin acylase family protein [Lacunisphaera sp.]